MFDLERLGAFLLASTLVILTPGPATLFVAGQAHRSGWRAARAAAGIVGGDLVLIGLSGLGFATLLTRWPALARWLTTFGALYVAWLGLGSLRAPVAPRTPAPESASPLCGAACAPESATGGFAKGLLLTLTNPKPILFFGAFFPTFLDAVTGGGERAFYTLGVVFELVNVAYFGLVILFASRLRRTAPPRFFAGLSFNRVSGAALLLCALLMLASTMR